MKEIICPHIKELKKNGGYFYKMIGCELDICNNCERKLRAGIIEQIKVEKEIEDYAKKHLWMRQNEKNKNNQGKRKNS